MIFVRFSFLSRITLSVLLAHLDKLEEQAIGNLDTEEAKIKSEIENLLEKLNKKAITIEILQSKLSAVKLYA
jgi:DNA-binding protein H-NS